MLRCDHGEWRERGTGNKRPHRREIRRVRLSNTFLFFSVLCNKHCTLHIRFRSLVFNSSSLLKIDQLACNNGSLYVPSLMYTRQPTAFAKQSNKYNIKKEKEKSLPETSEGTNYLSHFLNIPNSFLMSGSQIAIVEKKFYWPPSQFSLARQKLVLARNNSGQEATTNL